jgi:hypothetical protein
MTLAGETIADGATPRGEDCGRMPGSTCPCERHASGTIGGHARSSQARGRLLERALALKGPVYGREHPSVARTLSSVLPALAIVEMLVDGGAGPR